MDNTQKKLTLDEIKRDHPNTITPEILAKYLGKKPQNVRNMAKKGQFPFAIVEKRRTRSTYFFPTGRFIAWAEGRL